MPNFTVHVPPGVSASPALAERVVFVREGFSVAAFLFGPLFLLVRRLWLAAIAWVLVGGALWLIGEGFDLSIPARVLLYLILAAVTGLEAAEARRWTLGRRGYRPAALLAGVSRETGERLFFGADHGLGPARSAAAGAVGAEPRPAPAAWSGPVIGSFPAPVRRT